MNQSHDARCAVQAIRQLASLLRQADQLFTALGEEVVTIQTRTEGLGARVTTLATIADNYDPRKQPIRKWSGDNPRYVECDDILHPALLLLLLSPRHIDFRGSINPALPRIPQLLSSYLPNSQKFKYKISFLILMTFLNEFPQYRLTARLMLAAAVGQKISPSSYAELLYKFINQHLEKIFYTSIENILSLLVKWELFEKYFIA